MTPSIVQCCRDVQLFGAGLKLWPKQEELLAKLDAGPRIHCWALGRRAGKTLCGATAALHHCTMRPDLDRLVRRNEARYAVAVATNIAQARIFVRAARSIAEASPLLRDLIVGTNEDSISFEVNGARTVLAAFPCSSRGGRGWPISFLMLDEAAHMLDADSNDGQQAASRIFGALAPSTAQFGDLARIVISSTPLGDSGFFAEIAEKARSGELADACLTHLPTWEVNPTISSEFLQSEQLRAPEEYDAEYGASFVSAGGLYLDFSRFQVAHRGPLEPDALLPGSAIAGLDPAFSNDPFGLSVVARSAADPHRWVCALVQAWKPPPADSFEERREVEDHILDGVAAVCHRFGATAVTDQYLARSVVERLARLGVYVDVRTMSAASKTLAYQELRQQLYAGRLEIYDDPGLIAELRRLRTKHTAGSSTVVSPRVLGSHGDLAQSLALAAWAQAQRGGYGGGDVRGRVVRGIAEVVRGML